MSSAAESGQQFSCHPATGKKKLLLHMADSTRKYSFSSSSSALCSGFSGGIAQMNHDHLISILQLLPVTSIVSFSMTCKKFRSLVCSEPLWESVCRREWGDVHVGALVTSREGRKLPWKRLYQQVSQMGSLSCFRLSCRHGLFPEARASHSLNRVSDCLVLFGGGCDGGRHLDDTWVAYVGNGPRSAVSWQPMKLSGPSGRFGHTCTVLGDTLVLFGGINDNGIRQNDTWVGQVMHDGSPEIKFSWRQLDVRSEMPSPRGAHAACSVGDKKLVIHGGIGPNGNRLDDLWLLDLSDGYSYAIWRQVMTTNPSPAARSGHSLTWVGGLRMTLFGGRGGGYEVLNDVWTFDLGWDCPEWVKVVPDQSNGINQVPLPRVGHSAVIVVGNRILIFGGEDSYRHRKDDFWLLDVGMITDKKNASTVNSGTVLPKMWKRLKAEGQQPESRSFHAACVDPSGCYIHIFGGMIDGVLHPADAAGLRFDGSIYLLDLVLK